MKAWPSGSEKEPLPLTVSTQDVVVALEGVVASSSFGQLEDTLEHRVHGRRGQMRHRPSLGAQEP